MYGMRLQMLVSRTKACVGGLYKAVQSQFIRWLHTILIRIYRLQNTTSASHAGQAIRRYRNRLLEDTVQNCFIYNKVELAESTPGVTILPRGPSTEF